MMQIFLRQLADLCKKHRWRSKWVLVANHAQGHLIGERLVRQGVSWANLRFVTPVDIALQIAGPRLSAKDIGLLEEECGPSLMLKLLLDLPTELPAYFRPLADQPGMAEALWSAVCDLRLAGFGSNDLLATSFASSAKHGEIAAVMAMYEKYLVDTQLADRASVLVEALHWVADGVMRPDDLLLELPGACTNLLERQFVTVLPATHIAPRKGRIPELLESQRSAWAFPPVETCDMPTESVTDARRLRWLLAPAKAPKPVRDGTLEMFRAAGIEAEIEEVLHRIASRQLAIDTVEIACAQADTYAALLWEKAQRYGLPLTFQMGIPGVFTRPVRAVLALCDWIESNFSADCLIRLLQSGDLDPSLGDELSATAAGRILRRSGATIGRDTYALSLATEAASDRLRAKDVELEPERRAYYENRAMQVERVATWISNLLTGIPVASAADDIALGNLAQACSSFVSSATTQCSEDAAGATAVVRALDALKPLVDLHRPVRLVLGLVRNCIKDVRVCIELPRPGALHVTTLASAGYAGRSSTFVVGLSERDVFPRGFEDPVLLDAERTALAPGTLSTSRDRVVEAVHERIERLANLEGNVCLSFSCRDLRNGRETFPSWILLNAHMLIDPNAGLSYQQLNQYLGEPVSVVPKEPENALSDSGWWLSLLRGAGPASMPDVLRAFPGLDRSARAEAMRNGLGFTAYDGFVRQAGPALDIRTSSQAVSASMLEAFAICPFRYFLHYGLGVDALENREENLDVWLRADERGRLLHSIYAQFLRELRQESRRPVESDRIRLRQIVKVSIDQLRAQIPPLSESVFARETAQILRDLEFFLTAELEEPNRTPVGLEVSFGFAASGIEELLATPEPVTIDLGDGHRVLLCGRIDRIDRLSNGSFEVIDYKPGRLYRDRYRGAFAGGKLLQHALYSRAAKKLLLKVDPAPHVVSSTYYFATERGAAQRVSFPADLDVSPILRDLAEAIVSGTFPQAICDDDCRWCDYARGCATDGVEQSAAKFESGDAALAAYRRLLGHV
jgi:ATP-dependent helicase/nuclease subunit B